MKGHVNQVQDLGGVDGSADLRTVEEERGMDRRRYSTAAKSGYNLHTQDSLPDRFNGTISPSDEDERQPLLNRYWTARGDYSGYPRTPFGSEGTRKRRAAIESSTTTSSETSEVTAIPVPFYDTLWLWCLHCLSSVFARVFRKGKDF